MKSIYETFEDAEYERLIAAKGDMTWREFILTLAVKEVEMNEITTGKTEEL